LSFDDTHLELDILLDTTQVVDYDQRVEFRRLQTVWQLQAVNTQYNKWTFLPSLSAFYNYAWDFRDNSLPALFTHNFPRAVFGLSLQIGVFQGTRRLREIRRSRLLKERIDWDMLHLKVQ